jgi:hypothetical protein
MKKIIAIIAAALCFATVAVAQPKAIGLRATYGAELSYQHTLGPGFLEADLGLFNNSLDVVAIYDFNICPLGPLNFYLGPGGYVGMYKNEEDKLGIYAGVAAQIGLEYTFPFHLQLSLDYRPCFNFVNGFAWSPWGVGLGIRYAF